MAEEENYFRI